MMIICMCDRNLGSNIVQNVFTHDIEDPPLDSWNVKLHLSVTFIFGRNIEQRHIYSEPCSAHSTTIYATGR